MNRCLIGILIFLLNVSSSINASNMYAQSYEDNSDAILENLVDYLTKDPLYPLLKAGTTDLALAEHPLEVRQMEDNQHFSVIMAEISQDDRSYIGQFFVIYEPQPYQIVFTYLLCTSIKNIIIPSAQSVLDIVRDLKNRKLIPDNFKVHIKQEEEGKENGQYLQHWVFYDNEVSKEIKIVFMPDGEGSTFYAVLGDKSS